MSKFHENFLISRLKLRQLRLLTTIADEGTVLKGSQVLNIAQPAATKGIRELEEALGIQLFDRSSRGVTPTSSGDVMIRHAKLVLAQLRHAAEELRSLEEGLSGRIHVGTLLAASTSLLPRALARLRERRPAIAVTVAEGTIDRLMASLRTGDIDIVLGRLPDSHEGEGLHEELLYLDTVSIMVRDGHALTGRAELTLSDLVDQSWIMPPRQTSLRRQIEQTFRQEGLEPPHDSIESVSILTNHGLLTRTDMLAAVPHQAGIGLAGIVVLPIKLSGVSSRIGATIQAHPNLSTTAKYFLGIIQDIAGEIRHEMGQDQGAWPGPAPTHFQKR